MYYTIRGRINSDNNYLYSEGRCYKVVDGCYDYNLICYFIVKFVAPFTVKVITCTYCDDGWDGV